MDIVIDLNQIETLFNQPIYVVFWRLFYIFGWLPISIVIVYGLKELWVFYIQAQWSKTLKYMMLAIDIPRGNEQSPKAVENMFSYLAGAHGTLNLVERFWEGKFQVAFSLEIVSIDGYTQFLIRTPVPFRDLVESSIYSQYPDAEITEVNDYTENAPRIFPNDEYDVWGAEFIQIKNPAYPIKTYKDFEHQLGDPKETYRDPMATLMDLTSSLKKGEQIWYQIILMPIGFDWPKIGDNEISKILGEKDTNRGILGKIIDGFFDWISYAMNPAKEIEEKKEENTFKMMNLKPKEKRQIESINEKVGKLGFETKIRFVYLAKRDVMNKPKVANGFVGYMKQFAHMDLNNIKPDMDLTATSVNYFFKEKRLNRRKRNIVRNYILRDSMAGRKRGLLNIEELATIWHFPVESAVKAPLIQKASRRKAEPPMSLPVSAESPGSELSQPIFIEEEEEGGEMQEPAREAQGAEEKEPVPSFFEEGDLPAMPAHAGQEGEEEKIELPHHEPSEPSDADPPAHAGRAGAVATPKDGQAGKEKEPVKEKIKDTSETKGRPPVNLPFVN